MRFASLSLLAFGIFGCAASPRVVASTAQTASASSAIDVVSLDASQNDARAPARDASGPRVQPSADRDAAIASPRSFAELMDYGQPIWWRTDSARGPACTPWSARRVERESMPHVLSANVTIRCVTYTASVGAGIDVGGALALRGLGGSVSSRTGGSGWMRATSANNAVVSWAAAESDAIRTSEGPWFSSRAACEASSELLPSSAPAAWTATLSVLDALRSATTLGELRWVVASLESSGPPRPVVEAVERLFRDGATVWEPAAGGASCRSWRVRQDREQQAVLERTLPTRAGVAETQHAYLRWRPACGEFDASGCARTFRGGGISGGAQSSSYEGVLFVDRAGDDWIEVGERRLFRSRDACTRSRARRAGPMITACD